VGAAVGAAVCSYGPGGEAGGSVIGLFSMQNGIWFFFARVLLDGFQ